MRYLGEDNAALTVWIANEPTWPTGSFPAQPPTLQSQELAQILNLNSNHWRKVFNVYAKLLYALQPDCFPDWQTVRDQALLQRNHQHALAMAAKDINDVKTDGLVLIPGKQYADSLGLLGPSVELQSGVYRHPELNILMTPYFDYRALSNMKISALAGLIQEHWPSQAGRVLAV